MTRFTFNSRTRHMSESVSTSIAALRKLSEFV